MPHLLDVPSLWLFGALSLGIFAGWLAAPLLAAHRHDRPAHIAIGAVAIGALLMIAGILPARYGDRLELGLVLAVAGAAACYLLATSRWNGRPLDIGIGATAVVVLLAIAKVAPARYGHPTELGVVLAISGAIGCFVGWTLRDLAEFTPGAAGALALPTAGTGTYLFRDRLAGIGAPDAFMRAPMGGGGPARTRPTSDGLTKAPAPGGYTFPPTRPFADATTSRARPDAATGRHPHWTWRA